MNRMWDKNDIIKLIEEYAPGFDPSEIPSGTIADVLGLDADGDAVKGSLDGKYVKIVDPIPLNTPLSDEQLNNLVQGCFVNGVMAGNLFNPVIFPAAENGTGGKWGIMFARPYPVGTHFLCLTYKYNQTTKHLSIGDYYPFTFYAHGLAIQDKKLPAYPANNASKVFACVNGTLTWKNPLFLHTIVFDVGLGQTFTIRLMSDSDTPCAVDGVSGNFAIADATFVNPVNMGSVVIIPFGANQITPDIYAFDSATGAFTDNITLASVTSDTVTLL